MSFFPPWATKKSEKSPRKMANICSLRWKYKPCFELPKNSVMRPHKVQCRNKHHGSERSQDLHMRHWKLRTGHIPDWKTNELQNMARNIYDLLYFFFLSFFQFSQCSKFRCIKYAQMVWVTCLQIAVWFTCIQVCSCASGLECMHTSVCVHLCMSVYVGSYEKDVEWSVEV